MKLQSRFIIVAIAFVGAMLTLGNLAGGEKKGKDPEKKKEPAKPVVVDGELLNGDLKDKVQQNSYCKTYTFKMEKDKSYQLELTSTAFQPYLRLLNADGNQVAVDFDQTGQRAPATLVHRSAKTEDYEIVCTTINPNTQGKFTLTVKELTGDEGKPIDLKLDKGVGNYKGNLTKTDPKYKGKFHKLIIVPLEKGKTYQLDMTSDLNNGGFDSYLFFESPQGNLLAQDDDGGGFPSARIVHQAAESGNYRIICTYFGGGGFGPFNLQVTEKK